MKKVFEFIFIVFTCIFLIGLFSLIFQVIGQDSPNKATIISGLLSMIGGAVGALSAFLIARMQLTKQLELQDKKNREMFLAELKIKRAEEALKILYETRMAYFHLEGTWKSYVTDTNGVTEGLIGKKFDKHKLKNKPLIDEIDIKRDEFIHTFNEIYTLRPHFKKLIYRFIDEQEQFFKPLTQEINEILCISLGLGNSNQFNTYDEFRKKWIPRVINIEKKFENVIDIIHSQIFTFEREIDNIIYEFTNSK